MRGRCFEIGGLAVAPVEPHEDAEDLGIALRRHDRIGLGESRRASKPPRRFAVRRHRPRPSAVSISGVTSRGRPSRARRRHRPSGRSAHPGNRSTPSRSRPVRSPRQMMLGDWKSRSIKLVSLPARRSSARVPAAGKCRARSASLAGAAGTAGTVPVEQQLGLDHHRARGRRAGSGGRRRARPRPSPARLGRGSWRAVRRRRRSARRSAAPSARESFPSRDSRCSRSPWSRSCAWISGTAMPPPRSRAGRSPRRPSTDARGVRDLGIGACRPGPAGRAPAAANSSACAAGRPARRDPSRRSAPRRRR